MVGQESAEALALEALAYILAREDLLSSFLAATGAGGAELRAGAGDPVFLAAVLDHLLSDDALVTGFAAEAGLPPLTVVEARAALPGGQLPNWT
ncbi:DUF3572 domain-containing protein [Neotabrizicola sp. sgz301269]|uniref:DUF3572 domain-containing protein n=1 Tax=Neotabrizicola sp. sgz301269 TaxID=3276282 RepID=UPI00377020C7